MQPPLMLLTFSSLMSPLLANEDPTTEDELCPYGWAPLDSSCFKLVESRQSSGFPSVYAARQACLEEGADLAAPSSGKVHEVLYGQVQNISQTMSLRHDKVYIGIDDIQNETVYVFTRNKERVTEVNWGRGEPNNREFGNEDCVLIESNDQRWLSNDRTVWKDYPCCVNVGVTAVFCQIDLGETIQYNKYDDVLAHHCFDNVDDCKGSVCNNGNCEDELLGYHCVCNEGYHGQQCDLVVHCPPVPVWREIIPSTLNVSFGTIVNYTCGQGLVLSGGDTSTTTVCSGNATWYPPFQDCVDLTVKKTRVRRRQIPTKEAPGAAAIGSVGLIVIVVEMSLIVLLDLTHLHAHVLLLHRNVSHAWRRLSSRRTMKSRVSVNTISSCEDNTVTCNESIL